MSYFKIMCYVSGGVTGSRNAYMKDSMGLETVLATREEAEEQASEYNKNMNTEFSVASFRAEVVEFS